MDDFEALYRAVESRDGRWDGRVFVGVASTGIYCRPICPVPMPRREHVRFYPNAAAAERAGFRACRRCRPEESPESPDWDVRGDLVGRALRLIGAGVTDDEGVGSLARILAVSQRHLHRSFVRELGVGPLEVVQSRRAGLAKQLLDGSALTSTEVAFASGYRSVRAYNAAVRRRFGRSPTEIRRHRRPGETLPSIGLRLAYRPPLARGALLEFLAARAIPGVEDVDATGYRRAVATDGGAALLTLAVPADTNDVELSVAGTATADLAPLVRRARRLLDLDADQAAIDDSLAGDPVVGRLVVDAPGVRLPGAFDGWTTAVLAILAQGVSLAAARTIAGRIAAAFGAEVAVGHPAVTRLFPDPAVLATADLARVGLPERRRGTLAALAAEVAAGRIDLEGTADPGATLAALRAVPGIGPWTCGYLAMRALRDPDAFPPGDAALRRAFRLRGLPADDASIDRAAEAWRPWRGYATVRLWSAR